MQMVNALPAVLARVYNKAEACLYAKLFGNRGCNLHKMAHERAVVNHGNVIIMLLGHYQNMYWRLRLKVIESYRLVILVYLLEGISPEAILQKMQFSILLWFLLPYKIKFAL